MFSIFVIFIEIIIDHSACGKVGFGLLTCNHQKTGADIAERA